MWGSARRTSRIAGADSRRLKNAPPLEPQQPAESPQPIPRRRAGSGRRPCSARRPSPRAITVPSRGFSFALSGRTMPPAVTSAASRRFTRTLSPRGWMATFLAVLEATLVAAFAVSDISDPGHVPLRCVLCVCGHLAGQPANSQ